MFNLARDSNRPREELAGIDAKWVLFKASYEELLRAYPDRYNLGALRAMASVAIGLLRLFRRRADTPPEVVTKPVDGMAEIGVPVDQSHAFKQLLWILAAAAFHRRVVRLSSSQVTRPGGSLAALVVSWAERAQAVQNAPQSRRRSGRFTGKGQP